MNELKIKALSSTVWKFAERMIAQGVTMIVSIILARILSPDDYGTVSIVAIFFTFANVIISGGLNTALIQKKEADEEDYTAVLFLSLLVSFVICFALFLLAPFIAEIYDRVELTAIIRIMGTILPITAIKSVVCAYVSSKLQFRKFFFATIGGTLISAVVGITMAVKGFGAWSLVAQQMTNTIIDTVILISVTKMKLSHNLALSRIKALFGFGWKVLASSLIDTVYMELNPLFIGIRYSSADLSYYNKGKTFPGTISATVTSTLSAVLFPVLSKIQNDNEKLLGYVRLYIRTASFFVFPLMLGFLAVSDNFIAVVLTEKWMNASIYIKVFCLTSMFDMVASGNCQAMKAIGRSDIFLLIEVIKKASYFLIIGVFMIFTNSPVMLAVSMICCTAVSLLVNTFPNRKLIGYSYKLQAEDLLYNLGISLFMAFGVYLMNKIRINKIILLFSQIIAGMIIYIILCLLTRNQSFVYLSDTAKKILGRKKNAK